ncbi:TPA: tail fiber assembly protein, partial [Escherichia coli]|nr:tail fiber assembly protein [Escherichia coli]
LINESAWEEMTCLFAPSLAVATQRRDSEMALASARINSLAEAQDDGDITSEELAELAAWRIYRTALRRLDISTAPEIIWPERP